MRMNRLSIAIVLLLVAPIGAQEMAQKTAFYVGNYDVDSSTLISCVAADLSGDPWKSIQGTSNIKTSGSSATVTEVTTDSLPFADISVGDLLFINDTPGRPLSVRRVAAKASGASITIDNPDFGEAAAIDIENDDNGRTFSWQKVTCGTAATNGWIYVKPYLYKSLSIYLEQMNATSIDFKWECRHKTPVGYGPAVNVYPGTKTTDVCPGGTVSSGKCRYTAASQDTLTDVVIDIPYDSCRPLFAVNTDDGDDLTTNAESIMAFITVWGAK